MIPIAEGLIAVSATFTAEPMEATLAFWLQQLNRAARVEFAPFNQVFQTLLEPASLFARNRSGLNVVLLRWEDLGEGDQARRNGLQLIQTLKDRAASFAVPLLVAVCPASRELNFHELDLALGSELGAVSNLFLLSAEQVAEWYPVPVVHDPASDRLGHVPYTQEYFTALATAVARKFAAIGRAPYKVAVLDLDNTLWKGVAGEDGPSGITIDGPRLSLQQFLIRQREAGMLLAICSKNNEEDVREIFRVHSEMPLSLGDFAAIRINWEPKSQNLRALAAELSLGLDSFIFIDDDRKECAEVRANCPEVLTLLLPADPERIPEFLNNVWGFDRLKITAEDKLRNESYRQEQQRTEFSKQTASLEDFVAGLELRTTIRPMEPEHLARVAQLTQRTNQFNTTTIRRTEAETHAYASEPRQGILTVDVSDRFGDYGLVGAVFYREEADAAVVDAFLLSCRALGRGVEHAVVRYLSEHTGKAVEIRFTRSKKNAPAEQFLENSGAALRGGGLQLSHEQARALEYKPVSHAVPVSEEKANQPVEAFVADYARIADEYSDMARISSAVLANRQSTAAEVETGSDAPRNDTEERLAAIWARTLMLPRVGINDDFFEIGGYSLLAVELLRDVIEEFKADDLTLSAVLEAPTVAKFAELLESAKPAFSCLVPLRATGSRQPMFCVHGAGGNVLSLRSLAMNLPEDQPFWCLQAKGLDGSPPTDNVRDTAELYIREIQMIQPEGPYYIGGGSYGGLFAYEMARQLRAKGHKVAFLALFDCYNVAFGQMIPKSRMLYCMARFTLRRTGVQALRLVRSPVSKWPELLRSSARAFVKHGLRLVGSIASGPQNESQPLPAGPGTAEGDRTGLNDTLIRVREATMRAAESYVPEPYEGDVTIFAATTKMVEPYEDPFLGWKPLVSGKLEVETIAGDHITMGDEPALGAALNRCLARVQELNQLAGGR